MSDDTIGLDVALAVIQGMTSQQNAVTSSLIDSLQYDADRYSVLRDALCDFADQVDSRRLADQLFNLAARVHRLTPEQARDIRTNANLTDPESPRVNLNTKWSH